MFPLPTNVIANIMCFLLLCCCSIDLQWLDGLSVPSSTSLATLSSFPLWFAGEGGLCPRAWALRPWAPIASQSSDIVVPPSVRITELSGVSAGVKSRFCPLALEILPRCSAICVLELRLALSPTSTSESGLGVHRTMIVLFDCLATVLQKLGSPSSG